MRIPAIGRGTTALFAALLLLFAACGDDDSTATGGSETATEAESGDDGEADDDADEPDETTTTTTAETTTTTEAEPEVASGAECLIGTWRGDNEEWGRSFQSLLPAGVPIQLDSVTGTVLVEYGADGSVITTYDDWTINADVTQPAGTVTITRDGVDTGTYTAGDDGSFTMTAVDSNSTVSTESVVGGQTMALPGIDGVQTELIGDAGTYRCDGDRMSLEVEGATAWLDRVD